MRIAGDYAKLDSILAATGTTFGPVGMASIAAREHLIELAGGIDKMNSQTNSFSQNFLSKAEQLAPVQKYVTDQLAAMGLQSLTTRDQFKDYVLGLANSGKLATDAGAQQYTALLALADAFAKTHAATVDLTKSEQEIADERKDLQTRYDQATLTEAQLADKARAAIDGHNLALYDQTLAAEAAKNAADALASVNADYQKQIDDARKATMSAAEVRAMETQGMAASTVALYDQLAAVKASNDAIKKAQDSAAVATRTFGDALVSSMNAARDAAKAFRDLNDSLLIGDSSALSPGDKYAEAKRQFETADASKLAAAEKAFLDASKAWFGGGAGYAADFAAVLARNSREASDQDASAAAMPGIWKLFQQQMAGAGAAHENGGVASGWSLVGEKGPELVNFTQPGRVYTAGQSREMMGGSSTSMQETNALLRELIDKVDASLGADKTQRGAVGTAVLEKLDKVADKLDANKRALVRATT